MFVNVLTKCQCFFTPEKNIDLSNVTERKDQIENISSFRNKDSDK